MLKRQLLEVLHMLTFMAAVVAVVILLALVCVAVNRIIELP